MKRVGDITKLSKNLNAGSFSYEIGSFHLPGKKNLSIVLINATLNWKTLIFVLHNVACINLLTLDIFTAVFILTYLLLLLFLMRRSLLALLALPLLVKFCKYYTICIVIVRYKFDSMSIFSE